MQVKHIRIYSRSVVQLQINVSAYVELFHVRLRFSLYLAKNPSIFST